MRLLLDTHVLLWGIAGDDRLSPETARLIRSAESESFVSVASLWEIAIKVGIGKLGAPDDLPALIEADPDFSVLDVTADHVWRVRRLPRFHSDPFDHLLIVQALAEDMTIVTHDRMMGRYGVPIIVV